MREPRAGGALQPALCVGRYLDTLFLDSKIRGTIQFMADQFPIVCFCGRPIGRFYETYVKRCEDAYMNKAFRALLDPSGIEARVLDELGIDAMCCRRRFISFDPRPSVMRHFHHAWDTQAPLVSRA